MLLWFGEKRDPGTVSRVSHPEETCRVATKIMLELVFWMSFCSFERQKANFCMRMEKLVTLLQLCLGSEALQAARKNWVCAVINLNLFWAAAVVPCSISKLSLSLIPFLHSFSSSGAFGKLPTLTGQSPSEPAERYRMPDAFHVCVSCSHGLIFFFLAHLSCHLVSHLFPHFCTRGFPRTTLWPFMTFESWVIFTYFPLNHRKREHFHLPSDCVNFSGETLCHFSCRF